MSSDHLLPRTVFSCTDSQVYAESALRIAATCLQRPRFCTRGWSFWRDFIVHVVQRCKQLLEILQAQHNGALERKPYLSRSRNKKLKSLMKAAALMHDFTVLPRFFFHLFLFLCTLPGVVAVGKSPLDWLHSGVLAVVWDWGHHCAVQDPCRSNSPAHWLSQVCAVPCLTSRSCWQLRSSFPFFFFPST